MDDVVVVFGVQSGGYFAALDCLDASLLGLLIYTFPTIVAVSAIALGRERASLRTVSQLPRAAPYRCTASSPYCEQVGWKRHEGGVSGEIPFW